MTNPSSIPHPEEPEVTARITGVAITATCQRCGTVLHPEEVSGHVCDPSLSPDLLKSHDSSSSLRGGPINSEHHGPASNQLALKAATVRLRELLSDTEAGTYPMIFADALDVEMVLDELEHLLSINGQIARRWAAAEDARLALELAVDRSRSTPEEVAVPASPPTTQDREATRKGYGTLAADCASSYDANNRCTCYPKPSSPTSEPIPSSDQLREALHRIRKALRATPRSADYPYPRVDMFDVEAVLNEIDRLSAELASLRVERDRLRGPEDWAYADYIAYLETQLASLRSSSLTAGEADMLLGLTFGMAGTDFEKAVRAKLKTISTADKGNTK